MSVKEIVQFIGDYGVTIVCSAVMIFLFIKMTLNQNDTIKKTLDELVKRIGNAHPTLPESDVIDSINENIHNLLQHMQDKLCSDRAYLFLFHNGGKSLSGLSFQKMSCTNEVVKKGIAPCSEQTQLLHRGNFTVLNSSLKRYGKYFLQDTSLVENTDTFSYYFFKDRHVESVYTYAVKDSEDYIVGFIGIDYCTKNNKVEEKLIEDTLLELSIKISSLVDIKSKYVLD